MSTAATVDIFPGVAKLLGHYAPHFRGSHQRIRLERCLGRILGNGVIPMSQSRIYYPAKVQVNASQALYIMFVAGVM